jgi:AbrB family looped-hinge helix DNA binding protein
LNYLFRKKEVFAMNFVTVKKKYQVVIPAAVRNQAGIEIGDLLEAKAERGKLILIPKSAIDREIAEGLDDIRKGRVHGPFKTAEEMIRFLRGGARKAKGKARKRK